MMTEVYGDEKDKIMNMYMKWEKDASLYTVVSEVTKVNLSFWGWVTANGDVSIKYVGKHTNCMLGEPRPSRWNMEPVNGIKLSP